MRQLSFLDICSGIGGFRLGLEMAGHKCVGYCEYDKFARISYEAMYETKGEWTAYDVTKLESNEIPYADIWCFGFPCTDISVAGKRKGIVGKRSGIYFNIIDLIKGKKENDKPTYLLVENVKNLLSINSGFDFAAVLSEMDEAGYDCRWQVLNSKNHGLPQNRERVFITAYLRSRGGREILPVSGENTAALKQLIGGSQGYRVYSADGLSVALTGNGGGVGAKTGLYFLGCNQNNGSAGDYKNKPAEVHPVLTPDRKEKRQNGRRMKGDGEPMFTLTAQDKHGVFLCEHIHHDSKIAKYGRIRRLTPRECFRLQGFPDTLFDKATAVNSDSQLYKQAGNAVTVMVAYAVAMSLPESN